MIDEYIRVIIACVGGIIAFFIFTFVAWIHSRNYDAKAPVIHGGWCYICERNCCFMPHGPPPYECKACFKTWANEERYQQHMKETHGTHPYKCCVCNEKYQFLVEFKSHVELHTRVIDCPSCKQQFECKQKFASHCHDK